MNKKTFVFILVAVVIIGFVLGFAVAKNGGGEAREAGRHEETGAGVSGDHDSHDPLHKGPDGN